MGCVCSTAQKKNRRDSVKPLSEKRVVFMVFYRCCPRNPTRTFTFNLCPCLAFACIIVFPLSCLSTPLAFQVHDATAQQLSLARGSPETAQRAFLWGKSAEKRRAVPDRQHAHLGGAAASQTIPDGVLRCSGVMTAPLLHDRLGVFWRVVLSIFFLPWSAALLVYYR